MRFFSIIHAHNTTVKVCVFFSLFLSLLSINLAICVLSPFVLLSLKALNDCEKVFYWVYSSGWSLLV